MLVLSRKVDQAIVIDGSVRVTVVSIQGKQVRLGIEAPNSVGILREELCGRIGAVEARGNIASASASWQNSRMPDPSKGGNATTPDYSAWRRGRTKRGSMENSP
jgi:carbon storage regulator